MDCSSQLTRSLSTPPIFHSLRRWCLLPTLLTGFAACAGGDDRDLVSSGVMGDVKPGDMDPGNGGADDDSGGTGAPSDPAGSEPLLDLGDFTPEEDSDCFDEEGYEFNVIWIANSMEGTVSKIDTRSAKELARYRTGPGEISLSPSRTSVNLRGDVAVANRAGSVLKIAEKLELCVDADGDGEIQTSSGPDDVLPWGDDECVIWYHEIGFDPTPPIHEGGIRAVAWDFDRGDDADADVDCYGRPNVWIGWRDVPSNNAVIRKLVGYSGETADEVVVDNWQGHWNHGAYGGAIDPDGNFWALGTQGTLIKVDGDDLTYDRWDHPEDLQIYGMAIDADGVPWMASWLGKIWKFDLDQESFVEMYEISQNATPRNLRGLAIDLDGHAWIAGNTGCGLVRYDTKQEKIVDEYIELHNCVEPVGVSVDSDGDVWIVDRKAEHAYELDADTYEHQIVSGLVAPYTYSDMTGAGLGLVVPPIE
ncbi:MAG: hypothetical protein V3V08_13285 [Nannocystaceae bacterium]